MVLQQREGEGANELVRGRERRGRREKWSVAILVVQGKGDSRLPHSLSVINRGFAGEGKRSRVLRVCKRERKRERRREGERTRVDLLVCSLACLLARLRHASSSGFDRWDGI